MRERLRELANERWRFGYSRLHILLRREGIALNHKKLFRLYRDERLTVRRRDGRKRALGTRPPMAIPQGANQRWSLDFAADALLDGFSAPGGQAHCCAARPLLELLPPGVIVQADRAYDSNAIRGSIETIGMPNIPPKANPRWKNCFSPFLYRGRNAIERVFGRLQDFRRIATRYDRLASNYLAAVCLAATARYW